MMVDNQKTTLGQTIITSNGHQHTSVVVLFHAGLIILGLVVCINLPTSDSEAWAPSYIII